MLALDGRAEKKLTIANTSPVTLMTFPIGMSLLGGADATVLIDSSSSCYDSSDIGNWIQMELYKRQHMDCNYLIALVDGV